MRRSVLAAMLVGCGACGVPGADPDAQIEFAIAESVPAADAVDVSPDGVVEVTFTRAADPATIGPTTFHVTRGGVPVAGTITYVEELQAATFVPDARATLLGEYEVVVSHEIRDLTGAELPDDLTWTFLVADGEWSTGTGFTTGLFTDAPEPHVGVDSAGNAVAVWSQMTFIDPDFPYENVWAASYVADVGWSTPVLLETDEVLSARHPRVAVAPSGSAIAVWEQDDAGSISVWANRYAPSVGWGVASPIEPDAAAASQPEVAVDAAGNAWVVWIQAAAIRTARYVVGTGWDAPTDLRPANGDAIWNPRVAVGAGGAAAAAWSLLPTTDAFARTEASYHDAATGWTVPAEIETIVGESVTPRAAVGDDGTAVVAWQKYVAGSVNIWANRYVPGTGWGTALALDNDTNEYAWTPAVAVAPTGDAIVVWQHGLWIEASVLAGSTWTQPLAISEEGNGESPQIAFDPAGNALVVWADRQAIVSSRYTPGTGWERSTVALPKADSQSAAEIAVAADGTGVVVWEHQTNQSTTTEIWASAWR